MFRKPRFHVLVIANRADRESNPLGLVAGVQQQAFAQYPVAQQGGCGIQQDNVERLARYFAAESTRKPADGSIDLAGTCSQSIIDEYGNVQIAVGTG